MIGTLRLAALLLGLSLLACRSAEPPVAPADDPLLVEITGDLGLARSEPAWPDGTYFLPEITGPGVALLDFDGDGDLDLLQARVPPPGSPDAAAPNRFFRREADGRFVDATGPSGLGDPGFGQAIAVGDADNDGDPDVYFANFGRDAYYRNEGDGTFTDQTRSAGITDDQWSTAATFCDYDRDGYLDLYVVHYLNIDYGHGCRTSSGVEDYCGPGSFDGQPDKLYRNRGDGTFDEVTDLAGIRTVKGGKRAKGLGVVCLDLTDDGRPDIYVANDGEANQLWVGRPDGTFTDESVMRGVAVNRHGKPEASMGLTVGDVDRDGHLDLLSTHLAAENNTLYRGGKILFRDQTAESGMAEADLDLTGFGCALFDLEHDGDLDLAVVNGRVSLEQPQPSKSFWERYSEPNLLFRNDGTGRFRNASAEADTFSSTKEVSRGLVLGDLDGDGDLDLIASNVDNTLRAYRNDAPPADAHWLSVRTLSGARDALGSRVTLVLGADRRMVAPVLSNSSYQSAGEPRAHFGLGTTGSVESLEVVWPDGQRERFPVDAVDRTLVVRQGGGERL